jgi:hypothetical protein
VEAHCNVVFDANAPDAFSVHTGFYGNHISGCKSNGLAPSDPWFLVDFEA